MQADRSLEALEARRLLASIGVDRSFGDNGLGQAGVDSTSLASSLLIAEVAGSKILTVGAAVDADENGNNPVYSVAFGRLHPNGTVDTNYGTNGSVKRLSAQFISAATMQEDGKIVVTGLKDGNQFVARFTQDGALDTSFSGDGFADVALASAGDQFNPGGIAIGDDGKIVISGTLRTGDNSTFTLARFTATGGLDTAFSTDGTLRGQRSTFIDVALVAVEDGGRVLVTGREDDLAFVAGYTSAGEIDSAFGMAGFVDFPQSRPGGDTPGAISVQSDGRIVVGTDSFVARLTSTGQLDKTFSGNGLAGLTHLSSMTNGIAIDGAGDITLFTEGLLEQFNSAGQRNRSFGNNGSVGVDSSRGPLAQTAGGGFLIGGLGIAGSQFALAVERIGMLPDAALGPFGLLVISGDDADDTILLDASGNEVQLTRNGMLTTYPIDDVKSIRIDTGAGNNSINLSLAMPVAIDCGAGNDTIVSGSGDDSINAGDGDNSITSNAGKDLIASGDGNSAINAGDGDDTISTNSGNQTVDGGAGNDLITCGPGNNSVTGGSGADIIQLREGNQFVSGGDGNDIIYTYDGADTVDGGPGDDDLRAGNGDNLVTGGDGKDGIRAGTGNDSLYGNGGYDTIHSGEGSDLVNGGGGKDRLFGQQGSDRLYGGANSDQIDGGPGNDRMFGGAGNDKLFGGPGSDQLTGNAGQDFLYGIRGNDTLFGADGEADTLNGGGDDDQAEANDAPNADVLVSIEHRLV